MSSSFGGQKLILKILCKQVAQMFQDPKRNWEVSLDEIRKIIQSLIDIQSAISSCITVKHLTESVDVYLPILTDIIN